MSDEERIEELQRSLQYYKERSEADLLTGLYNRMSFEEYVKERLRKRETGIFFMMDIDNFKAINDRCGHWMGDRVLVHMAGLLKEIFPETICRGRMGGDEFAVYLSGSWRREEIRERITRLNEGFHTMAGTCCAGCETDCSIGITLVEHGDSFYEIYRRADCAMYCAKKSRRKYCWYEDEK